MENTRTIRCSENEGVAAHLLLKKRELSEHSTFGENQELTLNNAYKSIADCKTTIKTLKDLSQIKGVGKWILRLMKGFFTEEDSEAAKAAQKGRKPKELRRYVPRKNSVAYALLITLYRATTNGSGFMRRQELIDAAEASGLTQTSIMAEKGAGKPGQFGSSPRDWYTGWSCMKVLISKGLVVKSSCPAKYMLTDEGLQTARECLARSGIDDCLHRVAETNGSISATTLGEGGRVSSLVGLNSIIHKAASDKQICSVDMASSPSQRLPERLQYYISDSESEERLRNYDDASVACTSSGFGQGSNFKNIQKSFRSSSVAAKMPHVLQPCTSTDYPRNLPTCTDSQEVEVAELALPPHRHGERFEDIYDIILVLDDRENFGPRSRKICDILSSQFQISVEMRRLPVGDGIWLACHRYLKNEYVLDFIVERKRVDDLHHSIRDNRYRDQKLRLLRCGIQKLIYLVEGDPNGCEAAESLKRACFTTEILEGFDVQRTTGLTDTVKKYGFLSKAIREIYRKQFLNVQSREGRVCPSYDEFLKKCQDLEKLTISDVFALQLMQVPQVTEEIALAVVKLYPTLVSLARAYSLLEGNVSMQEEMLKRKNNVISSSASRNIFRHVWGP